MIRVEKKVALRFFAVLFQAHRSIDHVLLGNWNSFTNFYKNRKDNILYCKDKLTRIITKNDDSTMVYNCLANFFSVKYFLFSQSISFKTNDLRIILRCLNGVNELLGLDIAPDNDKIISLRFDIDQALILIEKSYYPKKHIKLAKLVTNYGEPNFFEHFEVDNIIDKSWFNL